MTTPPHTANGSGPTPGTGAVPTTDWVPGNAPPAWLPDEQTLSRLAGELFRALPGQERPAGHQGNDEQQYHDRAGHRSTSLGIGRRVDCHRSQVNGSGIRLVPGERGR